MRVPSSGPAHESGIVRMGLSPMDMPCAASSASPRLRGRAYARFFLSPPKHLTLDLHGCVFTLRILFFLEIFWPAKGG